MMARPESQRDIGRDVLLVLTGADRALTVREIVEAMPAPAVSEEEVRDALACRADGESLLPPWWYRASKPGDVDRWWPTGRGRRRLS